MNETITLEYVVLVKRAVWQCARPCSRAYRHRDERNGLLPAICPTCGHVMRHVDTYYQPKTEAHRIYDQGLLVLENICG
jgi:hypothetical protein